MANGSVQSASSRPRAPVTTEAARPATLRSHPGPGTLAPVSRKPHHGIWRLDLLHRFLDHPRRARRRAGRTRLRLRLGCRALAHSGAQEDAAAGGWGAGETIL